MRTKFTKTLAECIETSIKKGEHPTRNEAAKAVGYGSMGPMSQIICGRKQPSKQAFERMCAKWPALIGTLDVDMLKDWRSKNKTTAAPTTAAPKSATPCVFDAFDLAALVHQLGGESSAPRWIELFENACALNVPMPKIVAHLKSAQMGGLRG